MRFWMCLIVLLLSKVFSLYAQEGNSVTDKLINLPSKTLNKIDEKANKFENDIIKGTEKYLSKLQRQEKKLYKKLYKKDSLKAKEVFGDIDAKYASLRNELDKPLPSFNSLSNTYNSRLDTLNTVFNFVNKKQLIDGTNNPVLRSSLQKFQNLQGKLNASERIRKELQARKKLLQNQLQKFGLVKQFRQFKKQVYYYQQQIVEYKSLFEDPLKLEQKLTDLVLQIPAFKSFFADNSQLGNLFALPGSNRTMASYAGLQTRASVQQSITDRFGSGASVQQMLGQNMSEAQGMINDLKNRINSLGTSSSDEELPDFKPNNQKTKSFFKRIELGTNFQSQKSTNYFPNTSDLGLSLGYKINDNSVIGIGAAYKLGLGRGWNDISITSQGIGFRSFIDIKLKGSFWISGGYEQNYRSEFTRIDELKNKNAWQQSGLLGLSKVVSLKSKFLKKTKAQLLWDFLSNGQVPRTQTIIFRLGYSIN